MRFSVVEDDVLAAIKATPLSSAAGLNGVRLLHLSQLFGGRTAEAGHRLLNALTELCNSTIAGNIPEHTREAFTAIMKNNGGVRPIAIGSIYPRLVSNLLVKYMSSALAAEIQPVPLGVGAGMSCEAVDPVIQAFHSPLNLW